MRRLGRQAFGVLAMVCGLASSPAFAQTPTIAKVEFDEAIQRALEKNPALAQAANAIARAETLLVNARTALQPSVNGVFTNTTLDTATVFSAGVIQPRNQSALRLDASTPIIDLTKWAALPEARDQIDLAERSAKDVRRAIAVATAQAYLSVITQRRQVEINQRAIDTSRAHLDYAQKRLEGGAGSRLNQVRASQEVAAEQASLENARLGLRRAQEALGVLLAADAPVDAGAEPALETPSAAEEREWMQARTDVQLQIATRQAAERLLRDAWRAKVGTGTAAFTPQHITPAGLFQPANTWRFTISFNQPIFDRTLIGYRRARALAVEQATITLSSIELQARSEVRLAQESISSSQRALDSARLSTTQANDVLRITTAAFEVGATTNIEVIDAQRSARDSEATAALAEDALRRARLDLLIAMGKFPK